MKKNKAIVIAIVTIMIVTMFTGCGAKKVIDTVSDSIKLANGVKTCEDIFNLATFKSQTQISLADMVKQSNGVYTKIDASAEENTITYSYYLNPDNENVGGTLNSVDLLDFNARFNVVADSFEQEYGITIEKVVHKYYVGETLALVLECDGETTDKQIVDESFFMTKEENTVEEFYSRPQIRTVVDAAFEQQTKQSQGVYQKMSFLAEGNNVIYYYEYSDDYPYVAEGVANLQSADMSAAINIAKDAIANECGIRPETVEYQFYYLKELVFSFKE